MTILGGFVFVRREFPNFIAVHALTDSIEPSYVAPSLAMCQGLPQKFIWAPLENLVQLPSVCGY